MWLNEAQFYLQVAEGGLGEQVAAGLRELLRDPGRVPVLVLATLWPQFWDTLTGRPVAGGDDRHAQARELLAGHDIAVPAALTPARVRQLTGAEDPRLALAAAAAKEDGQVIQFLAGAPELLARYRHAPPAAAALISAAMDARRLGMGAGLPQAFLEAAAPGYLTDDQWDALGEDWVEQALAYAAVHAPLDDPDMADLPAVLWEEGAHEQAAALLARNPAAHVPLDNPGAVAMLLGSLRVVSADEQAAALLARNPAAHAPLDNSLGVGELLGSLREAGAHEQAAALLARDPAAHAPLDNSLGVGELLGSLREAGAHEQAAALLARNPAAHAPLDNSLGAGELVKTLRAAGAHKQAAALIGRLPAAGMFGLFLFERLDPADQFRFGREADGTPATPWGWEDLDLWLVLRPREP